MSELTKEIQFNVSGGQECQLRFLLKGERGAVQFCVLTGWGMKDVPESLRELFPMPSDLGYHSIDPRHEKDDPMKCDVLEKGECHYDGSTLNAEPVFKILLAEGHEGVWKKLTDYYHSTFSETAILEAPAASEDAPSAPGHATSASAHPDPTPPASSSHSSDKQDQAPERSSASEPENQP